MNITVENLAPCKKLIRVDVPTEEVRGIEESIVKEFQKVAKIPGFRVGKAPKHLVLKAYGNRIADQSKRQLVSDGYRKAVKEHELHAVGQADIEEIQFAKGQPFLFAITLETAPDFELPNYKGLKARRELRSVTEADVRHALRILQEQRATFLDVDRPVEKDDFVVIHYRGTCEGKPMTELAPAATSLAEKNDFWVHIQPDQFVPGFTDKLIGARAGERRTVAVEFPFDFAVREVAGKPGTFEVEVLQVKERKLPELNDDLAKLYQADSFQRFYEGVKENLESELATKTNRSVRDQLMQSLMAQVQCDLPESIVHQETKQVVYDLVRENQQRGISNEAINRQKDEIYNFANTNAKDRVKVAFIIGKIAIQEGIGASDHEVNTRIVQLAEAYGMKPRQMAEQLKERDGISEIQEQIVSAKVLALIEQHAEIEEVLPES